MRTLHRALVLVCAVLVVMTLVTVAFGQDEPPVGPDAEATAEVTAEATEIIFEVTPEPAFAEVVVEAAPGQGVPPPIDIVLPPDWIQVDDAIPLQDLDGLRVLPFTAYAGPVTGGDGFIILLWGFSSITVGSPGAENAGIVSIGLDGLRLLRLAVTDIGCVIGTDLELDREFPIGDRIAYGTYFQAVDCPESVDTRGWFAGLIYEGINMVFYAYTEPIEAMDGAAEDELQAILDSIVFDINNTFIIVTPTPTPEGFVPSVTPEGFVASPIPGGIPLEPTEAMQPTPTSLQDGIVLPGATDTP